MSYFFPRVLNSLARSSDGLFYNFLTPNEFLLGTELHLGVKHYWVSRSLLLICISRRRWLRTKMMLQFFSSNELFHWYGINWITSISTIQYQGQSGLSKINFCLDLFTENLTTDRPYLVLRNSMIVKIANGHGHSSKWKILNSWIAKWKNRHSIQNSPFVGPESKLWRLSSLRWFWWCWKWSLFNHLLVQFNGFWSSQTFNDEIWIN